MITVSNRSPFAIRLSARRTLGPCGRGDALTVDDAEWARIEATQGPHLQALADRGDLRIDRTPTPEEPPCVCSD